MVAGLLVLLVPLVARVALRELPVLPAADVETGEFGGTTSGGTPPPDGAAAPGPDLPRLRGVFHVHSDSSHDGRTPAAEQLAAARRLGLDFVIFTEHNRQPAHPSPRPGPVAVPGTELSTEYGHLAYVGYDRVPPEGGPRRRIGLVDSLRARGALTILTHPSSPRRPWTGRLAGIGGLEIASTSTDARVKADPFVAILPALLALPLNPRLALAQLYRRDDRALEIWDHLDDPAVIGMCGTDAHGWIDPELNFETWQIVLDPWDAPDPPTAEGIVDRIAAGRFVCVAGLVAEGAPRFSFGAEATAGPAVPQGESVSASRAAALAVRTPVASRGSEAARNPPAPGSAVAPPVVTVLLRDGTEVARTDGASLRIHDPSPGTYRVEVRMRLPEVFLGEREVPVLYSNRIRITE